MRICCVTMLCVRDYYASHWLATCSSFKIEATLILRPDHWREDTIVHNGIVFFFLLPDGRRFLLQHTAVCMYIIYTRSLCYVYRIRLLPTPIAVAIAYYNAKVGSSGEQDRQQHCRGTHVASAKPLCVGADAGRLLLEPTEVRDYRIDRLPCSTPGHQQHIVHPRSTTTALLCVVYEDMTSPAFWRPIMSILDFRSWHLMHFS